MLHATWGEKFEAGLGRKMVNVNLNPQIHVLHYGLHDWGLLSKSSKDVSIFLARWSLSLPPPHPPSNKLDQLQYIFYHWQKLTVSIPAKNTARNTV